MSGRVVAVLGYSPRRSAELHPVCAERLAFAQQLSDGASAVILSGSPEAELMRESWTGPDVLLICDSAARSTVGNARNVASAARNLGASELVVVTSRWHRARVTILLRAALHRSGIRLSVASTPEADRRRPLLLARELVCLSLLPLQLPRAFY